MTALDLLALALATWRLSHMIVNETGPYNILTRFRARFALGGLTTCLYCTSVWVGGALYLLTLTPAYHIIYILAASGGALMLRSYTGTGIND